MTETPEVSPVETALGQEFWTQPASALKPNFNFIYVQALAALRIEMRDRGAGVLDFMAIERLAFSYAILRQREADPDNQIADRTRREMNKDWLEFAFAIKKIWNSEDKADQSETLIKKLDKAIFDAVQSLPEEQRSFVQRALADSLEAQGL